MDNTTKNAYETYVTVSEQIKLLEAQKEAAKAVIKKYHADIGSDLVTEDGFTSKLIPQTTTELDKDRLLKKFGAEALAECYVTKTKTNFRCGRLLVEG